MNIAYRKYTSIWLQNKYTLVSLAYITRSMTTVQPKKGVLLVAQPSILGDISFNRSVILLADHNEEGSVGFILNKPSKFTLSELIPELEISIPIFTGGPVEGDNLYFIHTVPDLIPNSIEIANGIYWAGDFDVVISLLKDAKIGSNDIRFFLGYSGWDAEQLQHELKESSWIVVQPNDQNQVMTTAPESFWKEKMTELGGDYLIWSNAPENPSYN